MNTAVFENYLRDQDRSGNTARAYGLAVIRFAKWFAQTNGQAMDVGALTRTDVREWRDHMQSVEGLKPATINHRLAALQTWCKWLVETGQLTGNPVADVKRLGEEQLGPRAPERPEMAALERELERAVSNARTQPAKFLAIRDRAMLQLLAHTGLRVSELCALSFGELEISDRKGSVTVKHGKGNKLRTVPLNLDARRAMQPWLTLLAGLDQERDAVFMDWYGARLQPRAVQRRLKGYCQRVGITIAPHQLRHWLGKSLVDADAPLTQVAAIMGHSKLDTTRRYTTPTERDLRRAVEKLEG